MELVEMGVRYGLGCDYTRTSRCIASWPIRSSARSNRRRAGLRSLPHEAPMNRRPGSGRRRLISPTRTSSPLTQKVARVRPFGARPDDEEQDRKVLQDQLLKPTWQLVAGIFAASLFASFVSSPKFSAPAVWANSFRLDTALLIFWARSSTG